MGVGAQEKRGGKWEKGGWEAGFLRWRNQEETSKISQHFVIFCNSLDNVTEESAAMEWGGRRV